MWKVAALVGGTAGFLLGSYSGRRPYEQVEGWALSVAGRAPVRRVADHVSDAGQRVTGAVSDTIKVGANRAADVAAAAVDNGADQATQAMSEAQDSMRP